MTTTATTRATLGAISPFFIVTDVPQTIAFYRDKLGFEVRYQEPDENPFFAIVGRDNIQIFLKAERNIAPIPNSTRHRHLRLDAFIYVQDPDTLAAEFATRNVTFTSPLKDTHDGLRGFELADPNNYILFFGRPR
jgi:catechol 2,3-dioxygenase-like lactoylglutathione lyase family enzyme